MSFWMDLTLGFKNVIGGAQKVKYKFVVKIQKIIPETSTDKSATVRNALAQSTSYAIMDYFDQYEYARQSALSIAEIGYTEVLTLRSTIITSPAIVLGHYLAEGVKKALLETSAKITFTKAATNMIKTALARGVWYKTIGKLAGQIAFRTVVGSVYEAVEEIVVDGTIEPFFQNLVTGLGGSENAAHWASTFMTTARETKFFSSLGGDANTYVDTSLSWEAQVLQANKMSTEFKSWYSQKLFMFELGNYRGLDFNTQNKQEIQTMMDQLGMIRHRQARQRVSLRKFMLSGSMALIGMLVPSIGGFNLFALSPLFKNFKKGTLNQYMDFVEKRQVRQLDEKLSMNRLGIKPSDLTSSKLQENFKGKTQNIQTTPAMKSQALLGITQLPITVIENVRTKMETIEERAAIRSNYQPTRSLLSQTAAGEISMARGWDDKRHDPNIEEKIKKNKIKESQKEVEILRTNQEGWKNLLEKFEQDSERIEVKININIEASATGESVQKIARIEKLPSDLRIKDAKRYLKMVFVREYKKSSDFDIEFYGEKVKVGQKVFGFDIKEDSTFGQLLNKIGYDIVNEHFDLIPKEGHSASFIDELSGYRKVRNWYSNLFEGKGNFDSIINTYEKATLIDDFYVSLIKPLVNSMKVSFGEALSAESIEESYVEHLLTVAQNDPQVKKIFEQDKLTEVQRKNFYKELKNVIEVVFGQGFSLASAHYLEILIEDRLGYALFDHILDHYVESKDIKNVVSELTEIKEWFSDKDKSFIIRDMGLIYFYKKFTECFFTNQKDSSIFVPYTVSALTGAIGERFTLYMHSMGDLAQFYVDAGFSFDSICTAIEYTDNTVPRGDFHSEVLVDHSELKKILQFLDNEIDTSKIEAERNLRMLDLMRIQAGPNTLSFHVKESKKGSDIPLDNHAVDGVSAISFNILEDTYYYLKGNPIYSKFGTHTAIYSSPAMLSGDEKSVELEQEIWALHDFSDLIHNDGSRKYMQKQVYKFRVAEIINKRLSTQSFNSKELAIDFIINQLTKDQNFKDQLRIIARESYGRKSENLGDDYYDAVLDLFSQVHNLDRLVQEISLNKFEMIWSGKFNRFISTGFTLDRKELPDDFYYLRKEKGTYVWEKLPEKIPEFLRNTPTIFVYDFKRESGKIRQGIAPALFTQDFPSSENVQGSDSGIINGFYDRHSGKHQNVYLWSEKGKYLISKVELDNQEFKIRKTGWYLKYLENIHKKEIILVNGKTSDVNTFSYYLVLAWNTGNRLTLDFKKMIDKNKIIPHRIPYFDNLKIDESGIKKIEDPKNWIPKELVGPLEYKIQQRVDKLNKLIYHLTSVDRLFSSTTEEESSLMDTELAYSLLSLDEVELNVHKEYRVLPSGTKRYYNREYYMEVFQTLDLSEENLQSICSFSFDENGNRISHRLKPKRFYPVWLSLVQNAILNNNPLFIQFKGLFFESDGTPRQFSSISQIGFTENDLLLIQTLKECLTVVLGYEFFALLEMGSIALSIKNNNIQINIILMHIQNQIKFLNLMKLIPATFSATKMIKGKERWTFNERKAFYSAILLTGRFQEFNIMNEKGKIIDREKVFTMPPRQFLKSLFINYNGETYFMYNARIVNLYLKRFQIEEPSRETVDYRTLRSMTEVIKLYLHTVDSQINPLIFPIVLKEYADENPQMMESPEYWAELMQNLYKIRFSESIFYPTYNNDPIGEIYKMYRTANSPPLIKIKLPILGGATRYNQFVQDHKLKLFKSWISQEDIAVFSPALSRRFQLSDSDLRNTKLTQSAEYLLEFYNSFALERVEKIYGFLNELDRSENNFKVNFLRFSISGLSRESGILKKQVLSTPSIDFKDSEIDKSTLIIPNLKKENGKITNEREVKNAILNVIYYMFRYNALAIFTPGGLKSPVKRDPVLIMNLAKMYDHDILQTLMTRDREQFDVLLDREAYVHFESWKKLWDFKDKELIAATYIPYYMIWKKERMRRFYFTEFGTTIEDLGHDFTDDSD